MSPFTCARLDEVRRALAAGRWPQACAPDLRAHAAACSRCAQEVLLTTHLQQSRADALECTQAHAARPATPSLLWWRAQNRRRNAALEQAGRPLAAAQLFALAVVAAAILGIIATHWQAILALAPQAAAQAPDSLTAFTSNWGLTPLIVAATLITTLTGVVLYLTTERH